MLAVAPSTTKHDNAGAFALNKAPLFWGDDAESWAGAASPAGGGVGVAALASTDGSAEGVGSTEGVDADADVSEADSETESYKQRKLAVRRP